MRYELILLCALLVTACGSSSGNGDSNESSAAVAALRTSVSSHYKDFYEPLGKITITYTPLTSTRVQVEAFFEDGTLEITENCLYELRDKSWVAVTTSAVLKGSDGYSSTNEGTCPPTVAAP